MTSVELFAFVKEGGAYCAPLLLLALLAVWRESRAERTRLLESLKKKDDLIATKDAKIESLAERIIAISSGLEKYLFSKGVSL